MRRVLPLLLLLLSLGLVLAACGRPRGGGGRGGGGGNNDDDDAGDDDAGDDDDDDDNDDDDSGDDDNGDDDASDGYEGDQPGECSDGADNDQDGLYDCNDPDCFGSPDCQGDDDDAGDDDTGDDDTVSGSFAGTYCLDWTTVTGLQPAILTSLPLPGISLTDYPLLLSPTADLLGTLSARVVGAAAQTCTQDSSQATGEGYGTLSCSSLSLSFPSFTTSLLGTPGDVEAAVFTGSVASSGEQIVNGTLDMWLGGSGLTLLCSFAGCEPCPTSGADCLHVTGESAVWDRVSSSPLAMTP